MVEKILVACSICGMEHARHRRMLTVEVQFVCQYCRCADCQIVLDRECDCGETHGERSLGDSKLCCVCVGIRERVKNLPKEWLAERDKFFKHEQPFWE
jgi:hypothetical protein